MDKASLLNTLLDTLQKELQDAINASKDAADYATNEEARASSKWDTQGLEASYLAAGQASQARLWAKAIKDLQADRLSLIQSATRVAPGALLAVEMDGSVEWFFLARVAGGQVIQVDQREVTVLTPQSPLAARIRGLKQGDTFRLANGSTGKINQIE